MLTLDLSRTTGVGPLELGLSVRWDMVPSGVIFDIEPRVRLIVRAGDKGFDGVLCVTQRRRLLASLPLRRDPHRIGAPLRAICPDCGRLTYRLYVSGIVRLHYNSEDKEQIIYHFRCGKCLHVTYASGQRAEIDRANARMHRLEQRLYGTQWLPRHRGRRKIQAEMARQDMRWLGCLSASVLLHLGEA